MSSGEYTSNSAATPPPAASAPQDGPTERPHTPTAAATTTTAASTGPPLSTSNAASALLMHIRTAAAAAASERSSPPHSYSAHPLELMESIKGLHELHRQGGLTSEEFAQAKQFILDSRAGSVASSRSRGGGHSSHRSHGSRNARGRRHRRHTATRTPPMYAISSTSSAPRRSLRGSNAPGSVLLPPEGRRTGSLRSHRRHHGGHRTRSSVSSSSGSSTTSSSTSSSSSTASRFIVVPRAHLWQPLKSSLAAPTTTMATTGSFGPPGESSAGGLLVPSYGPTTLGSVAGKRGTLQSASEAAAAAASPMDNGSALRVESTSAFASAAPAATSVAASGLPPPPSSSAAQPQQAGLPAALPPATRGDALTAAALSLSPEGTELHAVGVSGGPHGFLHAPSTQRGSADSRNANKNAGYGTWHAWGGLNTAPGPTAGVTTSVTKGSYERSMAAELQPSDEVRVQFFNSRGATGLQFRDVTLREDELRPSRYLHKGRTSSFYYMPEKRHSAAADDLTAATHIDSSAQFSTSHSQPKTQPVEDLLERGQTQADAPAPTTVADAKTKEAKEQKPSQSTAAPTLDVAKLRRVADKMNEVEGSPVLLTGVPAALTEEEQQLWHELSVRSGSSRSTNSFLEQSLNWYWVDVTGRDPSQERYNAVLRDLTRTFNLSESFLVERDHTVVLPQVYESPHHPGQYMLNLRVATMKISISDDSVVELTNRWIIVVDLRQHVVITLHRVDTKSMALLRAHWARVMRLNEVYFQEFLLKIIDDAICTYQVSLDVHEDLLDKCESKLFSGGQAIKREKTTAQHSGDWRIMNHFENSSQSTFLRNLLDLDDAVPITKNEMTSFLHHLHRRTSVQHRMLNLTQTVLAAAFTKLQLCSKELANQMCGSCIELSDRALEVREEAKTLIDLHISLQTFRTNELMAVLTRVSILFTPCTFLAGVYGMNFRYNFPELSWKYGYVFFWVMCFILVFSIQMFFRRNEVSPV